MTYITFGTVAIIILVALYGLHGYRLANIGLQLLDVTVGHNELTNRVTIAEQKAARLERIVSGYEEKMNSSISICAKPEKKPSNVRSIKPNSIFIREI